MRVDYERESGGSGQRKSSGMRTGTKRPLKTGSTQNHASKSEGVYDGRNQEMESRGSRSNHNLIKLT
jgi:hypothetical protein